MEGNYKTLVLGASLKPYRYAHRAVKILKLNGYEVVPLGLQKGQIEGIAVQTGLPEIKGIHTVTLYLNAQRQAEMYQYILSLEPRRIIFNPGAENPELYELATSKGIYCENACTLVMLSTGDYDRPFASEAIIR